MKKGIQTSMAQGRSTKIFSMIKLLWTSRLSINNSLCLLARRAGNPMFVPFKVKGSTIQGLGCRDSGEGCRPREGRELAEQGLRGGDSYSRLIDLVSLNSKLESSTDRETCSSGFYDSWLRV